MSEMKTELRKIADIMGLGEYPVEMEAFYEALEPGIPAADLDLIDSLQKEFDLFGEFYEQVREVAQQLNADPVRSAWVRTATAYAMAGDEVQARKVPTAISDSTPLMDYLPLYILIPQIPKSYAQYKNRGFTDAEMPRIMNNYKAGIRITRDQTGRPGINPLYYSWLTLFTKFRLFYTPDGLQFEVKKLPSTAAFLKHKETGRILPIPVKARVHASGIQLLGSAGYEDEAGAFDAVFSEDAENYYGNPVVDNVIQSTPWKFPKTQWDCIGRPGDNCLGMHIPRKADISLETVKKACASARKIAAERYPEFNIGVINCCSWLLDPKLEELMGSQSKLAGFLNCFVKYPYKDSGKAIFGFVFPKRYESYETLPENTSLQRKLKQLYIDGGYIHSYGGIVVIEE